MTILNPYISFDGDARAAMTFYRDVLGGTLTIDTYEGFLPAETPAEVRNLVMHAHLTTEDGLTLMGADSTPDQTYDSGARLSISLSGTRADEARLRGCWDSLAAGGVVTIPLADAPWGSTFGGLTDKFGVRWFVNIGVPGE